MQKQRCEHFVESHPLHLRPPSSAARARGSFALRLPLFMSAASAAGVAGSAPSESKDAGPEDGTRYMDATGTLHRSDEGRIFVHEVKGTLDAGGGAEDEPAYLHNGGDHLGIPFEFAGPIMNVRPFAPKGPSWDQEQQRIL